MTIPGLPGGIQFDPLSPFSIPPTPGIPSLNPAWSTGQFNAALGTAAGQLRSVPTFTPPPVFNPGVATSGALNQGFASGATGLSQSLAQMAPAASGASGASGAAGLLGRVRAGGIAPLTRGAGLRALGLAGAGYMASNYLNAIPGEGNVEQGLQGAAAGAGIGAAAGSFIPGLGTAIGAGIGGAVGGLAGILGNTLLKKKGVDYADEISKAAQQLGLTPIFYTSAFNALTKAGGGDKQAVAAQIVNQMLTDQQTQIQAKAAEDQYARQRKADAQYALALQAQTAQFFAPITDNIMTSGAAQAATLSDLARQLPPQYAAVFEAQAANALSNTQRIAAAYAGQAGLLPQQSMASVDQQRAAEQAKYEWQTQVLQSQQGGGDQAFADLAKQLSGQQ